MVANYPDIFVFYLWKYKMHVVKTSNENVTQIMKKIVLFLKGRSDQRAPSLPLFN